MWALSRHSRSLDSNVGLGWSACGCRCERGGRHLQVEYVLNVERLRHRYQELLTVDQVQTRVEFPFVMLSH